MVDSSGYDFDPKVIEALTLWIQKLRSRRSNADQLILQDLLESQTQIDHDSAANLTADTCAADGLFY